MNFWNKICGAALVIGFTIHGVSAQSRFTPYSHPVAVRHMDSLMRSQGDSVVIFSQNHFFEVPRTLSPVSGDYMVRNYGFFCRQELHFEQRTRIPLRVRLGSVEICDHYEGKDR